MKKVLMTLAVAFIAVAANAQVYVGGNVGIASSKIGDADAVTTYKVLPEIGYNINQNWAIGTTAGWGKGNPVKIEDEPQKNPELFHGRALRSLHFCTQQVHQCFR